MYFKHLLSIGLSINWTTEHVLNSEARLFILITILLTASISAFSREDNWRPKFEIKIENTSTIVKGDCQKLEHEIEIINESYHIQNHVEFATIDENLCTVKIERYLPKIMVDSLAAYRRPELYTNKIVKGDDDYILFELTKYFVKQELIEIEDIFGVINSYTSGPNCFAFSLFNNNVIHGNRFVSPQELKFSLKNQCTPITKDQLKTNDIIVLFDQETPIHAMIYLSPTLAIQKKGQHSASPYQIVNIDWEIFYRKNKIDKLIWLEDELAITLTPDKDLTTNYYHCQSNLKYWQQFNLTNIDRTILKRLKVIDQILYRSSFGKDFSNYQAIKDEIDLIKARCDQSKIEKLRKYCQLTIESQSIQLKSNSDDS